MVFGNCSVTFSLFSTIIYCTIDMILRVVAIPIPMEIYLCYLQTDFFIGACVPYFQ